MKTFKYEDIQNLTELLKRPVMETQSLENDVRKILEEVKQNGDKALRAFTKKFDGMEISELLVSEAEIKEAIAIIAPGLQQAIEVAKANIEKFHASQKETFKVVETMPGVLCWRESVAIEKVGLYIPGGSAPLFSTILMLGIPAKLAGCKEIILCTPPDKSGKVNPAILVAADLVGVTKIYKVGGAQAIAAMAFGTESISPVYKIFGPGNQYVTCAKQLVSARGVAIDMPAGPSELMVYADDSSVPSFVAADLLSQAEHGADSQVILVAKNEKIVEKVLVEIDQQLQTLERKAICMEALKHSLAIVAPTNDAVVEIINEYAPEHLILACKNYKEVINGIVNAGSVFIGNYSCESAGDYASGTNHTLPTNGNAKAYSGVSLDSFVKKITYQKISKEGINNIGRSIELMAEAEGLSAHKNAVTLRLK